MDSYRDVSEDGVPHHGALACKTGLDIPTRSLQPLVLLVAFAPQSLYIELMVLFKMALVTELKREGEMN